MSETNEAPVDAVVIWFFCALLACGCDASHTVTRSRSISFEPTAIKPWRPYQGVCFSVKRIRGDGGQWVKVSDRGFVMTDATFWIEITKWDKGKKIETRTLEMDFDASDQVLIQRAFPDCGENPELFH